MVNIDCLGQCKVFEHFCCGFRGRHFCCPVAFLTFCMPFFGYLYAIFGCLHCFGHESNSSFTLYKQWVNDDKYKIILQSIQIKLLKVCLWKRELHLFHVYVQSFTLILSAMKNNSTNQKTRANKFQLVLLYSGQIHMNDKLLVNIFDHTFHRRKNTKRPSVPVDSEWLQTVSDRCYLNTINFSPIFINCSLGSQFLQCPMTMVLWL